MHRARMCAGGGLRAQAGRANARAYEGRARWVREREHARGSRAPSRRCRTAHRTGQGGSRSLRALKKSVLRKKQLARRRLLALFGVLAQVCFFGKDLRQRWEKVDAVVRRKCLIHECGLFLVWSRRWKLPSWRGVASKKLFSNTLPKSVRRYCAVGKCFASYYCSRARGWSVALYLVCRFN